MRRLLPSGVEIAIFAVLAVILAAVVMRFQPEVHDLSFAALVAPTFVFAAVMGLRRSPQWADPVDADTDTRDDA